MKQHLFVTMATVLISTAVLLAPPWQGDRVDANDFQPAPAAGALDATPAVGRVTSSEPAPNDWLYPGEAELVNTGSADSGMADGWVIQRVDLSKRFSDMTDRSLQLDAEGDPHIAYGDKHLYYAWYDGTWHVETVDESYGVGLFASLALDESGYPHISYYDEANGDLKYAYLDATGWHITTVDSEGQVGLYTSLALEATAPYTPHISYSDYTHYDLKYAYLDATGWHTETVDSEGYVGYHSSLALDGDGYAHISYFDYTHVDLKHAYLDAIGWHTETVDSAGSVGYYTSLALDGSGYAHISYTDAANYDLKYAYQDVSGWHADTVDSEGDVGRYTSLALEPAAPYAPHISYYDGTQGLPDTGLKHAYQNIEGWTIEFVARGLGVGGWYTSLALDESGDAHISYYGNFDLRHAYRAGLDWQNESVDRNWDVGNLSTSLALDGSENPHISYWESGSNGYLKYARWDGQWLTETVADGGGTYSSLALDASGNPRISYQYISRDKIKYAEWDGSQWNLQDVTSSWGGGRFTSLALEPTAPYTPHISYHYEEPSELYFHLKYAYWAGSGWKNETVEYSHKGQYNSLALDGSGNPHISYYSRTYGDLKYARWDGSQWLIETVDSDGKVGLYTSLALDEGDNPHISYYDETNSDLKYAHYVGAGGNCGPSNNWQCDTVDSQGDVGLCTSVALDESGNPHISYYDDANGDLKYARWDGSQWLIETADSAGDVGLYTSLALDGGGNPHISYYDRSYGDLKYAYSRGERFIYLPLVVKEYP